MKLILGQKLTLITISEALAHTVKREIRILSLLDPPEFRPHYVGATHGRQRVGTFSERGKRTTYYLDIRPSDLVFDGWDIPILIDSEIQRPESHGMSVTMFSGNACFNLWAETDDVLKQWIETRNINDKFSARDRASIIVVPGPGQPFSPQKEGRLLYPEIETNHAVINRIKQSRNEAGFIA